MARTTAARRSNALATVTDGRRLRAIDLQERGARDISPLELGLIELPTRPCSEYTMASRREALEAADGGRLSLAADLTRAAMTESGYARGILSDLTHGLWGLPRSFIGRRDMIADLDDTPERVGQWRTMFPQPEAIRLMSWGITLGVGVGQMRKRYGAKPGRDYPIMLEEANGELVLPKVPAVRPVGDYDTRVLRTWDPKHLRCQWWDETWWLMTADGEIRIDPNDGEWMLYLPYGEIKPWEYGAWRALTLAFILQRDALFDRARHSEKLAPVRVGTVPQGTTEKQRVKYLRLIRDMQRMAMFVLPPGLDYKIVESTGRIADIYEQIIKWANDDFAMLTGAIITASGSAGFSKGDVQERFTRSILASFGDSLCTCLHTGGLVPWALENHGTPDAPRAEFDTAPPEDKLARADTIGKAGEALIRLADGLARHGKRLTDASIVKYTQSLGFEVEDLPAGALPPTGDVEAEPAPEQEPELDPGDAPPTDEAAAALAAKMTQHGIARCEHGFLNRCPKCGIERLRDFAPGKRAGEHRWLIGWRPIIRSAPTPAQAGVA